MRDQHINSFNKGMMKDLGATIPQEGSYIDAENIRIISDGSSDGSSGVAINAKGNKRVLNIIGNISATELPFIYEGWVATGSLTPADLVTVNFGNTLLWETGTYLYVQGNMYFNNSGETQSLGLVSLPGGGSVLTSMYMDGIVNDYNPDDLEASLFAYGPINVALWEFFDNVDNVNDVKIIGYTVIRSKLILFTLIDFNISGDGVYTSTILSCDLENPVLSVNIIYGSADLNFSENSPIEAVGRYEAEKIQKVYWTDGVNPVRAIDVGKGTLDLSLKVGDLDLAPNISFNAMHLEEVVEGGGNVPSGVYYYGYRLRSKEGAKSRVSSLLGPVNVVTGNSSNYWNYQDDPENQIEYNGSEPGEETTKSVSILIENVDTDYDYIDLIVVEKSAFGTVSSAFIGDTVKLQSSINILTHINNSGVPLLIEEVTALSLPFSTAKTIATKDNRLFVGNIGNVETSLEFDSRAFRYKRDDAFNASDGVYKPVSDESEVSTYILNTEDLEDPAINPYNNVAGPESEEYLTSKYKYKKDGATIGGEGLNISYKFIKKKLSGDTYSDTTKGTAPFIGGDFSSDYKNPIIAEDFVGYQRDEVYRFGIVLYDFKGDPGFVNWIGDVRFPRYDDIDYSEEGWGEVRNFTLSQTESSNSGYPYTENYDSIEHNDLYEESEGDVLPSLEPSSDFLTTGAYNGGEHSLYALGIQFNVTIPEFDINGDPLRKNVTGFKIVRVKRTKADKSIIATGYLTPLNLFKGHLDDASSKHFILAPTTVFGYTDGEDPEDTFGAFTGNTFRFSSPDLHFKKISTIPSESDLIISGYLSHGNSDKADHEKDVGDKDGFYYRKTFSHTPIKGVEGNIINSSITQTQNTKRGDKLLIDTQYLSGEDLADDFKGLMNCGYQISETPGFVGGLQPAAAGEEFLYVQAAVPLNLFSYTPSEVYMSNTVGFTTGNSRDGYLGTIKKINKNRYLGDSIIDRSKNTYISCGEFVSLPPEEEGPKITDVWGGDTFVTFYDIKQSVMHIDPLSSDFEESYFPTNSYDRTLETGITLAGKNAMFRAFPVESTVNTTLRRGYHFANTTELDNSVDVQVLNSFIYNNVYSSEKDINVYIPKPVDFTEDTVKDNRIHYSESKVNSETSDSWRQFNLEDYRDVDGNVGALTKLVVYQDNMFFLQERGFGGLSISPVSTVVDNDGTSIVLGTGDVIQNFKYTSTTVGSQDQRSIINTTKGIYWVDKKTKKIHAFRANGLDSISDTHGMKSWSFDNIKHDSVLVTGNDVINDEVLFSIDDTTLVFSEHINKFTSFYTYGTPLYINTFDRLFSIDPSSSEIYEHNISDAYNWFGAGYESSIEFIVNKHPLNVKVFDTLEWYTESTTTSSKFTEAYASTSTSVLPVNGISEVVVKEGMTKMPVPRTTGYSRFRDTYMKVKLVSSNAAEIGKFVLHYVKTWFRISHR